MAVLFQLIDRIVCSSFVCKGVDFFWFGCVLEVQSFHKPVLVFNGLLAENNYQSLLFKATAVMFWGMKANNQFSWDKWCFTQWGCKVEFQCTGSSGLYILTLTKQAGAPCFKSDLFFHKTFSMLTFSSPILPVATFPRQFSLLAGSSQHVTSYSEQAEGGGAAPAQEWQ